MTHASLTCADVERSLSIHKAYYRSNRQIMKIETLCKHIVMNYNKNTGRDNNDVEGDSDDE